ncbi:MAG: hypothetical protein AAB817_02815 [Patescibacteria group bacterium]
MFEEQEPLSDQPPLDNPDSSPLAPGLVGKIESTLSRAGVQIAELPAQTLVLVRTGNTEYKILVMDPAAGEIIIEGGQHFPEPTRARLNGSTFGGSVIMGGWIRQGSHLEIQRLPASGENVMVVGDGDIVNHRIVTTSPVKQFEVNNDPTEIDRLTAATTDESQFN